MRAVVLERYGGPEVLTIRDIPDPQVGGEQVRIRVQATALNRADIAEREGHYPPPGKPPTYEVPGLECSGVVDQVGSQVTLFKVGDPVMALLPYGGYAQYAVAHERLVMPVWAPVALVEAAAIPEVFLTAFDALFNQGGARPGYRILIHAGASGVGSAATEIAHHTGMQVITTVGSQMKVEASRAFGAHRVVNYHEEDFSKVVKSWTQSQGVDVILDFIGKDYLASNLGSLAAGGTLVLIGALSGIEGVVNLGLIQARRLRIQGTALRSRPLERKMDLVQQFIREMGPFFQTGKLKPVIDRVYPLDEVREAHQYMESNQNIGKVVLQVATDDK